MKRELVVLLAGMALSVPSFAQTAANAASRSKEVWRDNCKNTVIADFGYIVDTHEYVRIK